MDVRRHFVRQARKSGRPTPQIVMLSQLLVERWTLTNQNQVGDPLIEWDVMNAIGLNPDMAQRAVGTNG